MKRTIHSLLSGALALLTMAACQVAELEGVTGEQKQITITAGIENDGILPLNGEQVVPETKTIRVADDRGTHVYWTPGDEISLFYGSGDQGGSKFVSTNTENAIQAQFTGTIGVITGGSEGGVESISFWGVYPYSKDNSCANGSVSLTIPSEQVSAENTFSVGQWPTVGKSLGLAMSFKNVACGYKFKVEHSEIKEIRISAKSGNLSGRISVSMDSSGNVSVADGGSGSGSVAVRPQGGGSFKPGVYYYVTMIHNPDYAQGITWTFVTETSSATYECDFSGGNRDFPSKISAFKTMDNKDSGLDFVSMLPKGTDFKDYLEVVAGGLEKITSIHFNSNASATGRQIAEDIYMSFTPGGRIDINTPNPEFIANPDCSEMFSYLSNLYGVYFNGCVNTHLVTVMSQMFSDCDNLAVVDFTGFDTSNVTRMYEMFYNCSALETLDLSSFNTRNATNMDYMFQCCDALKKVLLGKDFVIPDGCFADEYALVSGPGITFYGTTETMESFQKALVPGNDYYDGCLHFAIDMGEAGWWSAWNVGANKPGDYGLYFAWGQTTGYEAYSPSYSFDENSYYGSSSFVEWDPKPYGTTYYTLLPAYDAASANWGDHWHMPSTNDCLDLRKNCYMVWTNNYNGTGVEGMIAYLAKNDEDKGRTYAAGPCSYNTSDTHIFFPAAGYGDGYTRDAARQYGFYWSNTLWNDPLWTELPDQAIYMNFQSGMTSVPAFWRYYGLPVRPITSFENVGVTGISLDKTSRTLAVGESFTLSALIYPSKATNKGVFWSSNNPSVVTVTPTGKVTALSTGSATITAVSHENPDISATCFITVVSEITPPEGFVFLGMNNEGKPIIWAEKNLGASKPEEYGNYYAWGQTTGYKPTGSTFSHSFDWNSYCGSSSFVELDPKPYDEVTGILLPSYDAATKENPDWRTPTRDDFYDLRMNCCWVWTDNYNDTGVAGMIAYKAKQDFDKALIWSSFTVREYEYTLSDTHIFFPVAGRGKDSDLFDAGVTGFYWLSGVFANSIGDLGYLEGAELAKVYNQGASESYVTPRFCGCSVRPVLNY